MECGKCALPQQRIHVDLAADLPPPGCTDICDSYCSNSAARNTKNLYGCSVGLPVMGFFAATQVSDAGLDIVGRHGANRPAGRPPTPDSSFVEEYAILIQNSVEQPRAPRNSISCRKDHREQTFGHYVTALDGQGRPKLREGFHVACQTDTDCHSRCGIHPVNGMSYVCTKNLRLYDHQGSNETYPDGYYLDENNAFDIHNSSTGVCTDVR